MLILMQVLGFGAKNQGWWSNSQVKNRRAGPLCLLELFGSLFNLAKFHSPLPGPLANSVLSTFYSLGKAVKRR